MLATYCHSVRMNASKMAIIPHGCFFMDESLGD